MVAEGVFIDGRSMDDKQTFKMIFRLQDEIKELKRENKRLRKIINTTKRPKKSLK